MAYFSEKSCCWYRRLRFFHRLYGDVSNLLRLCHASGKQRLSADRQRQNAEPHNALYLFTNIDWRKPTPVTISRFYLSVDFLPDYFDWLSLAQFLNGLDHRQITFRRHICRNRIAWAQGIPFGYATKPLTFLHDKLENIVRLHSA